MFGMLDYRAHKLYLLIFFLPNTLLTLIEFFLWPFASYRIGFSFTDSIILQLFFAVLAFIVIGILLIIFFKIYNFLCYGLFTLFIDVIPHDGRNDEEAKMVVLGGKRSADLLRLEKDIRSIDDNLIDRLSQSWKLAFLYFEAKKNRLIIMRDYFRKHPDLEVSEKTVDALLEENNMRISYVEKFLSDSGLIATFFVVIVFILLLIYQPFQT